MAALIDHVESCLGKIQDGARLCDGVQGVRFQDCPEPGSTTFMTLGLSHHILTQRSGVGVRIELLVACQDRFVNAFNPQSRLAEVCEKVLPEHLTPPRGTVIGPRGRFFNETEMEALYCTSPVCFHEGLSKFGGFAEPFILVWLVPITKAEAHYVGKQGWSKFESLLENIDPDLLDLQRHSIV